MIDLEELARRLETALEESAVPVDYGLAETIQTVANELREEALRQR